MIVVQETSEAQKLSFIPRRSISGYYTVIIKSEYENKVIYNQRTPLTAESYYQTLTAAFDFKPHQHYTISVTSDDTPYFLRINSDNGNYEPLCAFDEIDQLQRPIVFMGRIYCSDSTEEFITHTTTNEFVFNEQ